MKRTRQAGRPRTMAQLLEVTSSRSGSTGRSANESAQLPLPVPAVVEEQANTPTSKVARGHSKGIPEWNTGVKVHVQFNGINFQPVGERAGQLKSQLGQIVRNGHRVPLNILDWKKVGNDVKEEIWEEVKKNLVEVPEGYKSVCLKNCNLLWKDHKSKTKSFHYVPNKDDPELGSKNPPHIVAEQWSELVAYWSSEDAKMIAEKNSINRELRGPCHKTGRKHFSQVQYEMEKAGEPVDKFSVWKKTRDLNDHLVQEFIKSYEKKLRKESEEDQNLTSVKDRIFHSLMGDDGHGYCRTFGAGVPRSLVYPKESNISQSTNDLVQRITEQVRQEFQVQLQQLHARIDFLQNKDTSTESPRQIADATSGHEILRESIGDEVTPNANHEQPSLEQNSPVISPSQNGSQRTPSRKNMCILLSILLTGH
ncbi:uncharacterized protein LOC133721963 isoform X2 [Rosa rugosa]|uniref:uncharacterized protein LOC133721963 isoform X2 n=1 Tax=Rosa rugosa TaxID=74645 RepID=UPI002B40922C|nr:uncharacterized protein LOC133721963 isoform X2 [Rosa rugosa]